MFPEHRTSPEGSEGYGHPTPWDALPKGAQTQKHPGKALAEALG